MIFYYIEIDCLEAAFSCNFFCQSMKNSLSQSDCLFDEAGLVYYKKPL